MGQRRRPQHRRGQRFDIVRRDKITPGDRGGGPRRRGGRGFGRLMGTSKNSLVLGGEDGKLWKLKIINNKFTVLIFSVKRLYDFGA